LMLKRESFADFDFRRYLVDGTDVKQPTTNSNRELRRMPEQRQPPIHSSPLPGRIHSGTS
jgi:hypothetical protein